VQVVQELHLMEQEAQLQVLIAFLQLAVVVEVLLVLKNLVAQVAVLRIQQVVVQELQVKGSMVVHHPMLVAQIMVAEAVVEQVK
tara:strand:+ start:184 stop:435 length:252 start_codon:yes stop_codon:yes gene_type:complete